MPTAPEPTRAPSSSRLPSVLALVAALALTPGRAAADLDRGADGQFSERRSQHFILLQDVAIERYGGLGGSRQFEQSLLKTLERAYEVVDARIGIRPDRDIRVVVYDPGVFDERFAGAFRFQAAGFFDGVIHVRGGTVLDGRLVRTLHHEYTHAALDAFAGTGVFPAWLNEGLAEYFERLSLGISARSDEEHAALREVVQRGEWIPLDQLSGVSLAGLPAESAAIAYLESYAVVDWMLRNHGAKAIERICETLAKTRMLDRALQRGVKLTRAELEQAVLAELR